MRRGEGSRGWRGHGGFGGGTWIEGDDEEAPKRRA